MPDPSTTEAIYLETCAPGGLELEVEVCRCTYRRIVAEFEPAEVEQLDAALRSDPTAVPAEVTAAAISCAAAPLSPGLDVPLPK